MAGLVEHCITEAHLAGANQLLGLLATGHQAQFHQP